MTRKQRTFWTVIIIISILLSLAYIVIEDEIMG